MSLPLSLGVWRPKTIYWLDWQNRSLHQCHQRWLSQCHSQDRRHLVQSKSWLKEGCPEASHSIFLTLLGELSRMGIQVCPMSFSKTQQTKGGANLFPHCKQRFKKLHFLFIETPKGLTNARAKDREGIGKRRRKAKLPKLTTTFFSLFLGKTGERKAEEKRRQSLRCTGRSLARYQLEQKDDQLINMAVERNWQDVHTHFLRIHGWGSCTYP